MILPNNFVTIFYNAKNVHLLKDVGEIPYFMHSRHGKNAYLVTYENDTSYSYAKNEVKGLHLLFLKNTGRFFRFQKAVLSFLWKNSPKIEILNLYFGSFETFVFALIYRIRNPKGTLYIKLDINIKNIRKNPRIILTGFPLGPLTGLFDRILISATDLITAESRAPYKLLLNRYPSLREKMVLAPNGVDNLYLDKHFKKIKTFKQKKDWIITVGRIGSYEKNNEMLLKAIEKIDLGKWKVFLIGPIEDTFQETIRNFYKKNPGFKTKVIFTGSVTDRKILYQYYNFAKVFCLTSHWEAASLVFPEALYFGNYIIATSTVTCAPDVTGNGKFGTIVPTDDAARLATALKKAIADRNTLAGKHREIISGFRRRFFWTDITDNLFDRLRVLSSDSRAETKKNGRNGL